MLCIAKSPPRLFCNAARLRGELQKRLGDLKFYLEATGEIHVAAEVRILFIACGEK